MFKINSGPLEKCDPTWNFGLDLLYDQFRLSS